MTISLQRKPTFRQNETRQLFSWIAAGESAAIIGASGIGKSNLFNHLLHPDTQDQFLGSDAKNTLIARINFHYSLDFRERSIFSLILEQLETLAEQKILDNLGQEQANRITEQHNLLLDACDDLLKAQRALKTAIRIVMHSSETLRLVLLFDQFDDVFREAPPRLFTTFRGLREAYKYRLSYLIFTRDTLDSLIEIDGHREEFCELFVSNVLGLKPYNAEDGTELLTRIANRYQLQTPPFADDLLHLSGRHAGLLRAIFLAALHDDTIIQADHEATIRLLLDVTGVASECSKLWNSLSISERRLLARLLNGVAPDGQDQSTVNALLFKGLLTQDEQLTIFSPLFHQFIQSQETPWEQSIYLDDRRRQVWVLGQPISTLRPLDYRLFAALYERAGEVLSKDELVEVGWPDAQGGVSDAAVTTAIYRLRQSIEPNLKHPRFIKTIRGQGHCLER
jgi:DNA-binding winged helix-turn-helix (wHTH) protein